MGFLRFMVIFGLVAYVVACGGSVAIGPSTSPSRAQAEVLSVNGAPRAYLLFRPPAPDVKHLAPLVIAIHGYALDGRTLEERSRYDDLAARDGFVVVYPQGVNVSWDAGVCCGGSSDDLAFIRNLVDKLITDGGIDPKRIFATGVSNGAMMAQRLACELSDRITAVASVSGALGIDSCTPSRAISVLEMHGTADGIIPFAGDPAQSLASQMEQMSAWAKRDGCSPDPAVTENGITTTYAWIACRDNSRVVLEAIAGGGHRWFGADTLPGMLPGEPSATQVTWDFFVHAPALP